MDTWNIGRSRIGTYHIRCGFDFKTEKVTDTLFVGKQQEVKNGLSKTLRVVRQKSHGDA